MSWLTQNGTAETVLRGQILRLERGQGNIKFLFSADHEQDWQPYPIDVYSTCGILVLISYVMIIHKYIHTHCIPGSESQGKGTENPNSGVLFIFSSLHRKVTAVRPHSSSGESFSTTAI